MRGRRARARKGQFVIIYIMSFMTMFLMAVVTLTVGQMLVRKQWAQLAVDAAAYAGAAKEAEALNTMAAMVDFEFDVLNTIEDRDREWPAPAGGWKTDYAFQCQLCYYNPWMCRDNVTDNHDNIKNAVYQVINAQVELLNWTARGTAYDSAEEVTQRNLQELFRNEYSSQPSRFSYPQKSGYQMVKLTELTPYFDETVAWYYWSETMMPWSTIGCGGCATCCPSCVIPCWCCPQCYECAAAIDCFQKSYRNCDVMGTVGLFGTESNHDTQPQKVSPNRPVSSYRFPEVLRLMHKGSETTFLWWLQVPSTSPVLGLDNMLGLQRGNVPPITVVARAKPYEGNLGRGEGNTEWDVWPKREWNGIPGLRQTWSVDWVLKYPTKIQYQVKMASVNPMRPREDDPILAGTSVRDQLYTQHRNARRYIWNTTNIDSEISTSIWH